MLLISSIQIIIMISLVIVLISDNDNWFCLNRDIAEFNPGD